MTTKKKVLRLVYSGENSKKETGCEYKADDIIDYAHYYSIQEESLKKEETTGLLHKMEAQPWSQTMLSERTFSYSYQDEETKLSYSKTYSFESNVFTGDPDKGINLEFSSTVESREDVSEVRGI